MNSTNKRRNNKRNRKQNRSKVKADALLDTFNNLHRIPRNLMRNSPFPMSMRRNLVHRFVYQLSDATHSFKLLELRLNGPFQPDLSNTASGFNELAAIYSLYQVYRAHVSYTYSTVETANPTFFGLVFRDIQPSATITTYATATDALEVAPATGAQTVGVLTGTSIYNSPKYSIDLGHMLGNTLAYRSLANQYGAQTNANPTGILWVAFVLLSIAAATNLTLGGYFQVELEFECEFWSPKVIEA